MFLSLQIKTTAGWQKAVLPPDTSIRVEDINPLFDTEAGGAFSYPFTLSVEANQHLFPTVTNHHGADIYDLIYHAPFRLLAGGYPILFGVVDIEDEVEIEEQDDGTHTVSISLASNNQELKTLLEGVNAQDVPLKDRIPVGTEFHSFEVTVKAGESPEEVARPDAPQRSFSLSLPSAVFSMNKYKASLDGSGEWLNSTNVTDPYPQKAYCNAMVAIQRREKQSDGSYKEVREYELFDADRQNSGICFYVQYFLDCLFAYIHTAWDNSLLVTFEDFNRLAFFTTKCECDAVPTAAEYVATSGYDADEDTFHGLFQEVEAVGDVAYEGTCFSTKARTLAWMKYANSKNFPDVEAYNIITELQKAFGLRFIYDSDGKHCQAIFIRDVFKDKTSVKSGAIIHSAYHIDKDVRGVKMTYGDAGDDDTNYNYDPTKDNSPVVIKDGYANIKGNKGAYDKNTYYDRNTGDMFRIKVDEDATTEEELYPSLFEVGQYQDAWVGNVTEKERVKEFTVGFAPVTSNIVEYVERKDGERTTGGTSQISRSRSERGDATSSTSCKYAVFLNLELTEVKSQELRCAATYQSQQAAMFYGYEFHVFYKARYGYTEDSLDRWNTYEYKRSTWRLRTSVDSSHPRLSYEEDPLSTYDAGFTLGVMRGPGNDAGADIVSENYDGNGNARWAYVPTSYAFTSDSIDHYGNFFDYNGEGPGGIDPTGRFSLKLMAEKVKRFQAEVTSKGSVIVRTAQEAAYWLDYLYPDSRQDLSSLWIKKRSDLSAKGWSVTGFSDYVPVYPVLKADGTGSVWLVNAIKRNGEIFTPSELNTYVNNLSATIANDNAKVVILRDAVQKDLNNLVALANIYYFPETAEPYTLTDIPGVATTDFYPLSAEHAHRGLLHKFNYEYFWFLINARSIVLDTTMTIQELLELDKLKWHTFGQYTGLIEKLSYEIANDQGLSHVQVTLLYL